MSEHDLLSDESTPRKWPWSVVIPLALVAMVLIHVAFDAGIQGFLGSCVTVDSQAELCLMATHTVE